MEEIKMQTKKEDIEQRIIEVATDEFMKKGYENTSMRVIAYKQIPASEIYIIILKTRISYYKQLFCQH